MTFIQQSHCMKSTCFLFIWQQFKYMVLKKLMTDSFFVSDYALYPYFSLYFCIIVFILFLPNTMLTYTYKTIYLIIFQPSPFLLKMFRPHTRASMTHFF